MKILRLVSPISLVVTGLAWKAVFPAASALSSSSSNNNNNRNNVVSRRRFFRNDVGTTAATYSSSHVTASSTSTTAVGFLIALATAGISPAIAEAAKNNKKSRSDGYEVQKSDAEWRSSLSKMQYFVLRDGGTERPNYSILESEERKGIFVCAGCGTPLFDSEQKFHSGTGWPSFAKGISEDAMEVENVGELQKKLGGAELRCQTCGGHLGDVFEDGFLFVGTPAFLTGKRFCIDGAALLFQPADGTAIVRGDTMKPKEEPDWLKPPEIRVAS